LGNFVSSNRIRRASKTQITDELLATYMRQQELEPIYLACVAGDCQAGDPQQHCAKCRECIELTNKLRKLTGATVWETSGLGADDPDPPSYIENNPRARAAWRQAWALHCALMEAAAAKA
jgi:hypothetical protein